VLNLLLPRPAPPSAPEPGGRVAAFKRFISDLERRGGGEVAPDFPVGADWLNAPRLSLFRELKGKVVVLDFWTFCCVNCELSF
jgi:thiol-disulfide isomerase/thioredoxin